MRPRTSIIIVVAGTVAVALAAVLTMHPSLSDAGDEVDAGWAALQPPLDQRFDALAALSRAVDEARPDSPALTGAVDRAVTDWKTQVGRRPTPDADAEARVANRAESVGARLVTAVLASPPLVENRAVVQALHDFVASDPDVDRARYNDAVDRYDSARARFPGRFFADLLGFEGVHTVELPVALGDVELPELPPEPEPAEEPAA